MNIEIRILQESDIPLISNSFTFQGWNKPEEIYSAYFADQQRGERTVLLVFLENQFAGYLTVIWNSDYSYLSYKNIPIISDLNVLIKFQKQGLATKLLDYSEDVVAKRSKIIGIGVGLTQDYGRAQRLYVKRGYIPDGKGINQNGIFPSYGDKIIIDDALILCLIKELN